MKKMLFFVFAALAIGFAGCDSGDDEKDSAQDEQALVAKMNELKVDRMLWDGEEIPMGGSFHYSSGDGGQIETYYVSGYSDNDDFRFVADIKASLLGKTIDLANPLPVVGRYMFFLNVTKGHHEENLFSISVADGELTSSIEGKEVKNASVVKYGKFTLSRSTNGPLLVTAYGMLTNGKSFVFKVELYT